MEAFADHWESLDAASSAKFVWFQSYAWCFSCMKNYENTARTSPYIIVVLEDEKPAAILPLTISDNRLGARHAKLIGEPHSQYSNILTMHDSVSFNLLRCIADALGSIPNIDLLSFSWVPEGSALAQVLAILPRKSYQANCSVQVDLSPTRGEKLGSDTAAVLSRSLRRTTKALSFLGEISLHVFRPDDPGFADKIAHCLTLKRSWLKQTARFATSVDDAKLILFLCDLPKSKSTLDGPIVFDLRAGKQSVALEIGFLQREHYYSSIGAFDLRFQYTSPGKLQIHHTMRWLADQGVKTFDLLPVPSEYKLQFASRKTELNGINIAHTWRGALFAGFWLQRLKPVLKIVFRRSPWLRKSLMHIFNMYKN